MASDQPVTPPEHVTTIRDAQGGVWYRSPGNPDAWTSNGHHSVTLAEIREHRGEVTWAEPGTPATSDEVDPAFEAAHQAAAGYAQIKRRTLDAALQSFATDGWFLTNGPEMHGVAERAEAKGRAAERREIAAAVRTAYWTKEAKKIADLIARGDL